MATKVLNNNCPDEIALVVEAATTNWEREEVRERRFQALLPVEKASVEAPSLEASRIDKELAALYPVMDYSAIMSRLRSRFMRLPVPFFAAYDINDPSAECRIRYDRENGSVAYVSTDSRFRHRVGDGYEDFVAYPEAATTKILSGIKNWESGMLIRGMATSGMIAAVLVFAVTVALSAPWLAVAIATLLAGGAASAIAAVFPGSSSDLKFCTKFAGVLSDDVRQKLAEVRSQFDFIVIVQEVNPKDWATRKVPKPRAADPLAMGFKRGIAYLICRFDTTPGENYTASEFGTRA